MHARLIAAAPETKQASGEITAFFDAPLAP